jgi:pimeloyl-ACP methyl ester carboxylesterase
MTEAYCAAFRAGDREAIATMIDFYGGPGTFAAWPERVRAYAIETTAVNILDWASVYGFPISPALLSTIDLPTLVLWGGSSHPAVQRANKLMSQCLDRPSRAAVDGAAHFMISTHAPEVARMVAAHVDRAASRPAATAPREIAMAF